MSPESVLAIAASLLAGLGGFVAGWIIAKGER